MENDSLWIFKMPDGHAHNMEIDVRNGPTEQQGGLIVRGPFTDANGGYAAALAWLVDQEDTEADLRAAERGWSERFAFPGDYAPEDISDQIEREMWLIDPQINGLDEHE